MPLQPTKPALGFGEGMEFRESAGKLSALWLKQPRSPSPRPMRLGKPAMLFEINPAILFKSHRIFAPWLHVL
jgi:hypothetical protein